jgi:hypothetical protein
MADVSRPEKFSTGQLIPAYLYASSSNYNRTVGKKCDDGERFNTLVGLAEATDTSDAEIFAKLPLELGDFSNKRFADYLVDVKQSGNHKVSLRICTDREELYIINVDGTTVAQQELPFTGGEWKTLQLDAMLSEGEHVIQIKTLGNARVAKFYWLKIDSQGN